MRHPLTFIVLLFALVAAACSQNDPVVATVGDTEIRQSEVAAFRDTGTSQVAISAERFRGDLTRVVVFTAIATGLEQNFGLTIDDDEIDQEYQFMLADGAFERLKEQNTGIAQAEDLYDFATDDFYRFIAWGRLISSEGQEAIASDPEFLTQIFQEAQSSLIYACQRHILVETEPEAQAVLSRLEAGEDFGAVAGDVSTDTGSVDGTLPCGTVDRWVEEFGAAVQVAPVGEVFGPVQSPFGYHIIIVDSRDAPTLDQLVTDPARYLPHPDPQAQLSGFRWHPIVEAEWNAWFNDQVRTAEVDVDPRIGDWSREALGIARPDSE